MRPQPRPAPGGARLATPARAVRAALWAANATDGLVDPTLVAPLEHAGYARSRAGEEPAPLGLALASAPPGAPRAQRRRALAGGGGGRPRGRDPAPPGVAIDTGGTGKGLAADAVADGLGHFSRFVVDCGGDLRVGGTACSSAPYEIEVEHPVTRATAHTLVLGSGAIATSGLATRLWRRAGGYAHHLLDPSTGMPAWTGLVSVTASAPTTLEAETLAKAPSSGTVGSSQLLAETGGLIVHESGETELVGPRPGGECDCRLEPRPPRDRRPAALRPPLVAREPRIGAGGPRAGHALGAARARDGRPASPGPGRRRLSREPRAPRRSPRSWRSASTGSRCWATPGSTPA